ncbi:MAG: hypothetical protein ABJB86_10785 [Bacteroidota bacterium]
MKKSPAKKGEAVSKKKTTPLAATAPPAADQVQPKRKTISGLNKSTDVTLKRG